jgi:serine/threonine-protein kinase
MSPCPDAHQLRKLLDGKLAPAEQATISEHVDGCPLCQGALERLSAGKESWNDIARNLAEPHEPAEPELAKAMNVLEAEADRSETTAEPTSHHELKVEFLDPPQKPGEIGRLGDYEILEVVGKGGMGIVLKAFDPELRRIVAIKVMSPMLAGHTTGRVRFRREAQAAAAVNHDHIVTIHAVLEAKGLPFIVMQYIAGRSLQQRIDDCGALELKEILRIGMQAASGLAAAHAQGLVHRDIKPANILLENGIERVKITDFGLARATDDARVTQSGIVAGTPQYMSPEQAGGKSVDHRADLFSLGGVLYAMCTGYAPFRASSSMAVLKKVCDESPRPIRELNPEIPDWLAAIVDKLMAKDPKDRFQSAQEVASLLGQHLAHMQQPAVFPEPPGVTRPTPKKRRNNSWVAIVIVGVVLLVICPVPILLAGAFFLWTRPSVTPVGNSVTQVNQRAESGSDDTPVPAPSPRTMGKKAVEPAPTHKTAAPARTEMTQKTLVAPKLDANNLPPPLAILKSIDPKTDKPLQSEFGGKHVSVEDNSWRIDSTSAKHDAGPKYDLKLYLLPKQNLQNSTAIIRFKMKANRPLYACILPMLGEQAGWYAGIGSQLAQMADSFSASTDWRTCEVKRNYRGAEPVDITIVADIDGPGTIWIRDLDVMTVPLSPAAPASNGPNQVQTIETVLKKFDPKTDKPFQTELADRHASIEGDSWRIDAKKAPASGPGFTLFAPDIRLFELPKQNIQQSTIVLRFKMKSEKLTTNACVGFKVGGQPTWREGPEFNADVIGTTDWKNYEVFNSCKDSVPTDIAVLANIGGTGTIWLKDIELVKIPLPTPASPPPTAVGTPLVKETILKKFDPKNDKPITNSVEGRKVTEQDGGWQVEVQGNPKIADIDNAPRTELFELRQPDVAGRRITLRAQMKTELMGHLNNAGIAALELELGPVGAAAQIGPVRRDASNWSKYEVSIDWLRPTYPETLKINALVAAGSGKLWIKDLEIVTTPLLDLPAAAKKDAENEAVLFRFGPDQKPITTEIAFMTIKPDKDAWCVANGTTAVVTENDGPRLRLFELAKPDLAGYLVTVRCKVRSDKVTWAHLYLRGDSDGTWLTMGRKVEGSTNWTDYEFTYDVRLSPPERISVEVGLSAGAIWLKDLELVKTPTAELLELSRLQGSWQAIQGEHDDKALTDEQLKHWRIGVDKNRMKLENAVGIYEGEFSSITVTEDPRQATVFVSNPAKKAQYLLYQLNGDTWKVCGSSPPGYAINQFDAKAGSNRWLVTFKRVPGGKPGTNDIVLKKFDPKYDKPVTKEVNLRKVSAEGEEWKIELQGLNELGSLDEVSRVHLFEAPGPANEPSRITLRFKVKTEDVYDARLDVHVRRAALEDVVVKGRLIEGTTNWTTHEISWDGNMTSKPASVAIDLVMRAKDGTTKAIVSLKDVELVKTPLPK